jgi:hypothetical protein
MWPMTLGATLRHGREKEGLTCDDIARATRIPLHLIVAIEQDDWATVPGGIFARGYVRAYAREAGLDGEALVARYQAEHAPPPPAAGIEPEASGADHRWPFTGRWPRWTAGRFAWMRLAWPALAVVLLALYLAGGRAPAGGSPASGRAASARGLGDAPASSLGGRVEAPVGTTASPADVGQPADNPLTAVRGDTPLAMELVVARPCWLTVTVDGSRRIYRLVRPGERVRQEGSEFVIRAGDAGALQLSFDGKIARPLGASGAVVTVRITRDNYRSLLESASEP